MNVVVCGSRSWTDWRYLWRCMDKFMSRTKETVTIWTGGCPDGADRFAEHWAESTITTCRSVPVSHAEWLKFGKKAGPLRNRRLLQEAAPVTLLIAFLDYGRSPGTRDMIQAGLDAKVPEIVIIRPKKDGLS